jgi:hypothetical protein
MPINTIPSLQVLIGSLPLVTKGHPEYINRFLLTQDTMAGGVNSPQAVPE